MLCMSCLMDSKKSHAYELIKRFKRYRRFIVPSIAILLALLVFSPWLRSFKFFYAIEQASLSLRFLIRGIDDPAEDVARIILITIDDRSLFPELSEEDIRKNPQAKLLMEPWPWNRAIHGFIGQRLIDAGASVVAYDLIFPTANPGDFELLDVIEANNGKIVLGYDYTVSINELEESQVEERLPYDDLLPVDETGLLGFVNIRRDPDGVLRRAKLRTNIFKEKKDFASDEGSRERLDRRSERVPDYPSLALQTAQRFDPKLIGRLDEIHELPIINYGGFDYFETVSYIDVLLDDRFSAHKDIFDGSIVMVGPFSDFFKDVQQTPFGDMYGMETHGHVVRSLLNDSFYQQVSNRWLIALIAALACCLSAGFLWLRSASAKGVFLLVLLTGNLILSQVLFEKFFIVTPLMPVIWLVGLGGIFLLMLDYIIEQYERKRLKGYLDRYVSPEVAQLIVQDPSHLDQILSGAKRSLVAMFVDIRGFTAVSESMDPAQLVEQLNEYFEATVEVILTRNGSLNKYIGDAILAVWGGIYSDGPTEDCRKALEASTDMLEVLERLNQDWSARGMPRLDVGIGLSFGEGFVGNLGHSQRKEFAVMGDVVNLASRLEGLTKLYSCRIILSEDVSNCLEGSPPVQEIDIVRVKGRSTPVRLYRPIDGNAGDLGLLWANALQAYRDERFTEASQLFRQYALSVPKDVKLAQLFINRCQLYQEQPPESGWGGVTTMHEK